MNDVTLRLVVAVIIGFMLIAAAIMGNPGSILASLIDAESMSMGPIGYGGSAAGTF